MLTQCFGDGPFVYRLNDNGVGPNLLVQVCVERGWREYSADNGDQWNLWWKTSGFPLSQYREITHSQFTNHIPKGSSICRKDHLARHLKRMRKVYGSIYDFSPHCYNLPLEYTKLAAECTRSLRPLDDRGGVGGGDVVTGSSIARAKPSVWRWQNAAREAAVWRAERGFEHMPIWICKPVGQSQGRGIFLFRKLSELTYDSNSVVQRYIERPLLIAGYKFDLRLYVCIPSYHPLTIYLYREGLARFGTDKFSLSDLDNPFRHLTNSSINKMGPGYSEMKERIGSGCKWSLRQLRRYFQHAGINDWLLWQRISCLIVLTLLSHVPLIPPTVNCFEFFGFDVLLDSELKPWLLEVNLSPALGNDCQADEIVKRPMLHDLFDLLGLPLYNTGLALYAMSHRSEDDSSGDDNNNNKDGNVGGRRRKSAAMLKWRKHHNGKNNAGGANRPKSKSSARSAKKNTGGGVNRRRLWESINSPGEQIRSAGLNMPQNGLWGNGKNWREAQAQEGGWMRIFPNADGAISVVGADGNVRDMVTQMQKFKKTAYDTVRNNPSACDDELNKILKTTLALSSDIWLPYD